MAVIDGTTTAKHHAKVIYDPGAATPIQGVDANHSVTAKSPHLIHVDAIAAGTSAVLQAKILDEAEWGTVDMPGALGTDLTLDDSNTPITLDFSTVNFVQLVRVGSDNFKAYAQGI